MPLGCTGQHLTMIDDTFPFVDIRLFSIESLKINSHTREKEDQFGILIQFTFACVHSKIVNFDDFVRFRFIEILVCALRAGRFHQFIAPFRHSDRCVLNKLTKPLTRNAAPYVTRPPHFFHKSYLYSKCTFNFTIHDDRLEEGREVPARWHGGRLQLHFIYDRRKNVHFNKLQ